MVREAQILVKIWQYRFRSRGWTDINNTDLPGKSLQMLMHQQFECVFTLVEDVIISSAARVLNISSSSKPSLQLPTSPPGAILGPLNNEPSKQMDQAKNRLDDSLS